MNARERFLGLLKNDILKLDLADLSFGVYRILNARRDLVLKFLDEELPSHISTELKSLAGTPSEDEEARIYAALDTFFHRYWDDGDFILRQRRGRGGAYSVPYDGSDDHFHWATKGSHYVKSGEFLRTYAFKPDEAGGEVRFQVVSAQEEKDNVKGAKRYFVPVRKSQDGVALVFSFAFRPLAEAEAKKYEGKKSKEGSEAENGGGPLANSKVQDRLLRAWLDGSDFKGAAVPAGLRSPGFSKHVARYVRRQTSDFFVHPQLGPFLEGELDYYLKNEFLQVWDHATPDALVRERGKFGIVRNIGRRIISFLHQIEDFQARVFEKRKFVLRTDWLVMASALAEREGGSELVATACGNKNQVAEWRGWVGDEKSSGKALLAKYPHLPIHTIHFGDEYRCALLECFDDIEAESGGLLVNGDNYGALRTLEPAFLDRIQAIYIDPPYNTDAGPIDYKNEYKSSSWSSLIHPRVLASRRLLRKDGIAVVTIDDYEVHTLAKLLQDAFGHDNELGIVAIRNNPSGRSTVRGFSVCHEYAFFFGNSPDALLQRLPRTEKQLERFTTEEGTIVDWRNFRKDGGAVTYRSARPKQFYPIFVTKDLKSIRIPKLEWNQERKAWNVLEKPASNEEVALPVDDKGRDRVWSLTHGSVEISDLRAKRDKDGKLMLQRRHLPASGVLPRSWWDKPAYAAREHGSAALSDLFGDSASFSFAKSPFAVQDCIWISGLSEESNGTVLDFFAGSGTTAHAVMNMNRQDNGNRRFALVEQANYFDAVLVPRVAKVMACPSWKAGLPQADVNHNSSKDDHWSESTLPLVKILRIERYEDSLDALETREEFDARRAGVQEMAGADYTLRYLLEEETRGSTLFAPGRLFDAPFSAKLPVHTPSGLRPVPIDLAETTLAMLGLRLVRIFEATFDNRRYRIMATRSRTDEAQLVILRDLLPTPPKTFWEKEYRWLAKVVTERWGSKLSDYARVWHNGDTLFLEGEHGASIDSEFTRVMQERDPNASG